MRWLRRRYSTQLRSVLDSGIKPRVNHMFELPVTLGLKIRSTYRIIMWPVLLRASGLRRAAATWDEQGIAVPREKALLVCVRESTPLAPTSSGILAP